jgi:hypothetical protein
MTVSLSLQNEYNQVPLQNMNVSQGRLRGSTIRRIIEAERTKLQNYIRVQYYCCCIPLKSAPSASREVVDRKWSNLALVVSYALFMSGGLAGYAYGLTTDQYPLLLGMTPLLCAYAVVALVPSRIIETAVVNLLAACILNERILILTDYLADDDQTIAQSSRLAKLVSKMRLSNEVTVSLIEEAGVGELKVFLQDLQSYGGRTITFNSGLESVKQLILAPPADYNCYHELVQRARVSLLDADDYDELRNLLPEGDARRDLLEYVPNDMSSIASSSNDVVIDIPEEPVDLVIRVGDKAVGVDRDLIKEQSGWFAVYFCENFQPVGAEIIISGDKFQRSLVLLLENLSKAETLWTPWNSDKIIEYQVLLECMQYYQFHALELKLRLALFEDAVISFDQKMILAEGIVKSPKISEDQLRGWQYKTFNAVTNGLTSEEEYLAWLDFGMKHFPAWFVPMYTGFLLGKKDSLSVRVVTVLVARIDHFGMVERKILNWTSRHPHYLRLQDEKFLTWFGSVLKRSESKCITIDNFKEIWKVSDKNELIEDALVRFALSNRDAVLNLWQVGSVPRKLIEKFK